MHTSGLIPLPVGARAKRIAASAIATTGTEYGWPEGGAMLVTGVFSGIEFANGNAAGTAEGWLPLSAGSVIPVDDNFVLRTVTGAAGTIWLGLFGSSECPELAELALIARMVAGNSAPQDPKQNPFPLGSALADADPNPTTTRLGSNNLGYNGATWDRIRAIALNADGLTPATLGALLVGAQDLVFQDRSSVLDRLRQPDSFVAASTLNAAVSILTTGVKSTVTMAQAGWITDAAVSITTAINSVSQPVIQLRLTRSAVTTVLGVASLNNAGTVGTIYGLGRVTAPTPGGGAGTNDIVTFPFPVAASDVIDLNVSVVAGSAGACDFRIGSKRERFAF